MQKTGGFIRKIFAYGLFFVLGVLSGNIFGSESGALGGTANLISQTGKEVFQPSAPKGASFSLPLEKAPIAGKAAGTPVASVVPPPPRAAAVSESPAPTGTEPVDPPIQAGEASAASPTSSAPAETPAPVSPIAAQPPTPPAAVVAPKLLIFEVQITGGPGRSEEDFIKIYNPTPYAVDASGWKLRKRSKTGGEASIKVVPDGTNISSGALFVWANSKDNFAASVGADISSTATISADNSIAILDPEGKVIDAVAWGGGDGQFMEGSPYPANPEAGQILRRKTGGVNLLDTDNNSADFSV